MNKTLKRILSICLILIMALSLSACGEIKKAENAVNNMFTAFKSLDFEEAEKYVNVDEITMSDDEEDSEEIDFMSDQYMMMRALFGRLDHKIVSSEKIDNDTVNVTTDVTAVEMKPILTDFLTNAIAYAFQNAFANLQPTEEETAQKMSEMFMESAQKSDLSTVTTTATIKVVRKDKEWKIETDEEFINAVLGGGVDAAEELSESFSE